MFSETDESGNQCCYGSNSQLLVGPLGGGTVDLVPREISEGRHFIRDVLPYLLCCKGSLFNCNNYYRHRPSDNGRRYNPPPPGMYRKL